LQDRLNRLDALIARQEVAQSPAGTGPTTPGTMR
jgi:hypothetical protein